jgi:hypothetical protein
VLYEYLALVDAIRGGLARERKLSGQELSELLRRNMTDRYLELLKAAAKQLLPILDELVLVLVGMQEISELY